MATPGAFETWIPNEGRTVPTACGSISASLVELSLGQYLWNNRVYDVLDYGTVSDGSGNASTGIAAALAAAPASGAIVRIPPGTYRLDSAVALTNQPFIVLDRGAVIQVKNNEAAFLVDDVNASAYIVGTGVVVGVSGYTGRGVRVKRGTCLVDGMRGYQLNNYLI